MGLSRQDVAKDKFRMVDGHGWNLDTEPYHTGRTLENGAANSRTKKLVIA